MLRNVKMRLGFQEVLSKAARGIEWEAKKHCLGGSFSTFHSVTFSRLRFGQQEAVLVYLRLYPRGEGFHALAQRDE